MEFGNFKNHVFRVGNYLKESTSRNVDSLKADRRLGGLQDEINDAYRMLGYLFYTEMKTAGAECCDYKELHKKSTEIIAEIDKKIEEVEYIKSEIAAGGFEKNANPKAPAVCSYCGAELNKNAKFCVKCGKPVT